MNICCNSHCRNPDCPGLGGRYCCTGPGCTVHAAFARTTDPQTSHDAARSVGDTSDSEYRVLVALRAYGPCTHGQLIAGYNEGVARGIFKPQTDQGIRSRCSRLVEYGLAKAVGVKKGGSATGRDATLWQAISS